MYMWNVDNIINFNTSLFLKHSLIEGVGITCLVVSDSGNWFRNMPGNGPSFTYWMGAEKKPQDILDLPPEIIDHIYKYCDARDLANIASCSQAHYESVQYLLWSSIALSRNKMEGQLLPAYILEKLKFTSELKCFETYSSSQPQSWMYAMINCNNVVRFCNGSWLTKFEITLIATDYTMKLVTNECRNIRELKLKFCFNLTCSGWQYISSLQYLKKLSLQCCEVFDCNIAEVVKLPRLENLQLIDCDKITDKSMEYIGTQTQLKKLTVSSNRYVTTKGLVHISKLINLVELDLSFSTIDDYIVTCICVIPIRLRKLDISLCSGVTDVGIIQLSNLVSLQQLNIQDDCISKSTLKRFCESTGMKEMAKYCHYCDDITLRKR